MQQEIFWLCAAILLVKVDVPEFPTWNSELYDCSIALELLGISYTDTQDGLFSPEFSTWCSKNHNDYLLHQQ